MSLRINRKHMSQPPGGYSYTISGFTFTGKNADEVIKKIDDHRSANGQTPGDPEHDLALSMAKDFPWLILDDATVKVPTVDMEARFISSAWKSTPFPQADHDVFKSRFSRCLECPKMVKPETKDKELLRRMMVLTHPTMMVAGENGFGFCENHLWICSVACSMKDANKLATGEKIKECWVNDTDKENGNS
jgi:hypothetical protein